MSSSIVLLLLLVALVLSSASANFVSIDCGSSDSYTDENKITWVGDGDYVQNGNSQAVQTANGVAHVMSTLRVFPTTKKNCYSIPAEKGSQFLVRASFYYGNYDKKSAPPSFDLQLDGNYWDSIQTSAEDVVYDEVIYVVKGDSIELCLALTQPNQLPFISAIEIRGLKLEMYNQVGAEYAMLRTRRVAYGATEAIRYPGDDYDRIWDPVKIGSGLIKVTNDAQIIDTSVVPDHPPVTAFQYAITTSKPSESIVLITDLPDVKVPIYILMYFSEVAAIDSTETRSFNIFIDGKSVTKEPIVPVYGSVTEMYITNITASSNTSFALVATSDSTLPPLINAMEVYYVSPIKDSKKKSRKLPLIIGATIPSFIIFWVIVVVFVCAICNSSKRRAAAIAAANAGQNGRANMPNGQPPQGGPMNPQMAGKFEEVVMNQHAVNVREHGTPEQVTPEHIRNQQVEERPLHY